MCNHSLSKVFLPRRDYSPDRMKMAFSILSKALV